MGGYWTVAVVDAKKHHWVIWHVSTDIDWPDSAHRLVGAWKVPVEQQQEANLLIRGHPLLLTDDPEREIPTNLLVGGVINPEAIIGEVLRKQEELLTGYEAFREAHPPSKRKKLVPPRLMAPLTLQSQAPPTPEDPDLAETLRIATWLGRTADLWADMDTERKRRYYLAEAFGREEFPRPLR